MNNPHKLSRDELLEKIVECAQILDDANVPTRGRFLGTEKGLITTDGRVIPWEEVNKE